MLHMWSVFDCKAGYDACMFIRCRILHACMHVLNIAYASCMHVINIALVMAWDKPDNLGDINLTC